MDGLLWHCIRKANRALPAERYDAVRLAPAALAPGHQSHSHHTISHTPTHMAHL
jgi:hypothetical protein